MESAVITHEHNYHINGIYHAGFVVRARNSGINKSIFR